MPERRPCDCGCSPNTFSDREAADDLKRYLEKGPDTTTRALVDSIVAQGVEGATVLDVGGGIGAIQLELLAAGAGRAEAVDASDAYVETARAEAERRGYGDRTSAQVGNFVELAPAIEPADVVTLDRVVCCYPDVDALLGAAADKATRIVGLVYPRDIWWNRVVGRAMNAFGWLTRDPTRWYLYPTARVDGIMRRAGFVGREITRDWIWQVVLYRREGAAAWDSGKEGKGSARSGPQFGRTRSPATVPSAPCRPNCKRRPDAPRQVSASGRQAEPEGRRARLR